MSLQGYGITIAILGLGSFILPFFGLQFKIMNLFGSYSWIVGIIAIIAGAIIFVLGKDR